MSRTPPMKGNYIYFLYDDEENLIYIGKTTKLKKRLMGHLYNKLENWRKTINKSKITLFKCSNLSDLELYETYFINKYNPKHNRDKAFNQIPTFDLPYIEPIPYEYVDRNKYKRTFKYYCLSYIDSLESRDILPPEFQIIKEIYEKLGAIKMQALLYRRDKLEQALFNLDNQHLIEPEIRAKFIPGFYSRKEVKLLLLDIYKKLGIKKWASAKDIELIFNTRLSSKMIDGKNYSGYFIVEGGGRKRKYKLKSNISYKKD